MTETFKGNEGQPVKTVDRHDPKIMEGLEEAPIYKKQGEVKATFAQGGEVVVTKLADGTEETRNTAKQGDAIITNPGGEQYIIGAEKFGNRYEPKVGEDGNPVPGVFSAKGYCRAIDNPFGNPITMMASWGEMQNGARDVKIADVYDKDSNMIDGEPYIIGKEEFLKTYKVVNEKPDVRAIVKPKIQEPKK